MVLLAEVLYTCLVYCGFFGVCAGIRGAHTASCFRRRCRSQRRARIAGCHSLLSAQDYPNFEVVVVDDRSTDTTAELIAGWVEADKRFKLIGLSGSGSKKAALTAAIAEAAGEVIATTNADCAMGDGG